MSLEEFEVGGALKVITATNKTETAQTLNKGLAEKEACLFSGINTVYLILYYPT